MTRSRRAVLQTVAALSCGGTVALAGCSGSSESVETVGDDFESGSFDYSFHTNNSTQHDWGTREREEIPSDESVVGFVRQNSTGRGHGIQGYSDDTYDVSEASGLDLLCYGAAYDRQQRWNNGSFVVWDEAAETRQLRLRMFDTNDGAEANPFRIAGELVEEQLATGAVTWAQDRWYRVLVDFEETSDGLLARGKLWDPTTEEEPDEYAAESRLAEGLGDAHRVGFAASGRFSPLEVHYDYWQFRL